MFAVCSVCGGGGGVVGVLCTVLPTIAWYEHLSSNHSERGSKVDAVSVLRGTVPHACRISCPVSFVLLGTAPSYDEVTYSHALIYFGWNSIQTGLVTSLTDQA